MNLFEKYAQFVDGVTSPCSKNIEEFIKRMEELSGQVDICRLDAASDGLCGESGELKDTIKKVKFHGKPWTEEIRQHLIKEIGDISWYWMNACIALKINPEDVILKNIKKLEDRYPGGVFSIEKSENRTS